MIYLEATLRVMPGKMHEFMDVSNTKLGRKLLGQWFTTVGTLDEVNAIWGYDDLTHMQRFNEARAKSAEAIKASEHLRPLIVYETVRLMAPTPLSPMK
jgi:hypothetical protein